MSLRKLWEIVKDREAWCAAVHGVTKSRPWLSNWTTTERVGRGWEASNTANLSIFQMRKLRPIKNEACAVTQLRCKGSQKQKPTCPALPLQHPASILSNKEMMQNPEHPSCHHEQCSQYPGCKNRRKPWLRKCISSIYDLLLYFQVLNHTFKESHRDRHISYNIA